MLTIEVKVGNERVAFAVVNRTEADVDCGTYALSASTAPWQDFERNSHSWMIANYDRNQPVWAMVRTVATAMLAHTLNGGPAPETPSHALRFSTISSFSDGPDGNFAFLSNFAPARVSILNEWYPTTEHAYQAAKFTDPAMRAKIAAAPTPGKAKRLGRSPGIRPNWEEVKIEVMRRLIRRKFKHPGMRLRLRATGDAILIEGNTWGDRFWGQCGGRGENWLGRLLMEERARIRKEATR